MQAVKKRSIDTALYSAVSTDLGDHVFKDSSDMFYAVLIVLVTLRIDYVCCMALQRKTYRTTIKK
jgi:hypothetical protein